MGEFILQKREQVVASLPTGKLDNLDKRVKTLESNPGGSGTPAVSVTDETTYGTTPAVGISTNYARQDHTHGSPSTPTKTTVGLGNVDNTSDINKPVSTAQQSALDAKSDTSHNHTGVYAPVLGVDDNYVTDAEKVIIGNTSGTNSGDNATNTQYSGLATSKQDTLVSGTNIKTINGSTVLGSGDLVVGGVATWGSITGTLSSQTDLQTALDGKQASGSYLTSANIVATITNGDTTHASSSDALFDALALKEPLKGADDNYVTDAEKIVIGNTSGTNTGDNATNTQYSSLVSNATHTGDATGSTALTVVKIQGKDFPTLAAGDDQKYPKYNNATNAFVMTSIAGGGDVTGDDVSTTTQNIVAYSGTGGKNITELTGTQGDVLYHNGTSWTKLGAGTSGHFLKTNGAGANPAWAAAGGGGYTLVATLAGDQATGANVTPVTLTGLVFTYEANSTYRVWAMGRVAPTAATTGCGFQFDLSSAVTAINIQFYHQLANTGTLSGGNSIADDASVGVSSGMPGTSTYPVTVEGLLVTGANTGTAQLRFRSETTAVTTCKAGFTLVVEKVA